MSRELCNNNKIRQIEVLYQKSSYNLCAQLFLEENCRLNYITTYYKDITPEKNKKKIIKFLRALKTDISLIISPYECLFYIFHCFIPFTYDFVDEVIKIINPPSILYIGIMIHYYETNYFACKNLNCCGINKRYDILQRYYSENKFIYSLRYTWIVACINININIDHT